MIGYDGLVTLEQLCDVIHEEGLPTEVLAASIEKPQEIVEYALAGADIVTMPYHVFTDTFDSPLPLTKYYVDRFYKDWSGWLCDRRKVRSGSGAAFIIFPLSGPAP